MTDEIDDLVRAAASAHQGLVGADYFDELPARVLARLDRDERLASVVPNEVAMMSDTTSKDSSRDGLPLAPSGGAVPERTDDSGLHDMKALAQTAKQRISRRITSQHDAYDESLLSSSQSGLRAVALPAPAQLVSLPALPGQPVYEGSATVTPVSAASEIRTAKKSKAAIWVAGGGLLAAAAAAAFIIGSGGSGNSKDQADPAAAGQVAAGPPSAAAPAHGTAAATGAPGAGLGSVAAPTGGAVMPPPTTEVTALDPAAAPAEAGVAAVDKADRTSGGGSVAREERDQKAKTGDSKVGAAGGAVASADKQGGGKKGEKTTGAGDKVAVGNKGGGATAGGDKSIEDLLSEASGGAQKPSDSGGGGGEVKPDKTGLDGKDIRSGMGAVASKAQACYDQHGVSGHVKVKAVVDPSGKVTKADATGEFAGTPTGTCVAGVVKGASFATWTGAPMTISYGFTLQE